MTPDEQHRFDGDVAEAGSNAAHDVPEADAGATGLARIIIGGRVLRVDDLYFLLRRWIVVVANVLFRSVLQKGFGALWQRGGRESALGARPRGIHEVRGERGCDGGKRGRRKIAPRTGSKGRGTSVARMMVIQLLLGGCHREAIASDAPRGDREQGGPTEEEKEEERDHDLHDWNKYQKPGGVRREIYFRRVGGKEAPAVGVWLYQGCWFLDGIYHNEFSSRWLFKSLLAMRRGREPILFLLLTTINDHDVVASLFDE